ncbi:hypothetical protein ACGFXC_34620 [Streptomyces sp. NPDC048507]|uniref:hypothetical protein n=1 Tax=Streptomyces sp. NPDC048507 TaxID=3365560 RepID=UPI00371EF79E
MRFQSFILAPAGYLDLRAEGCDVPSAADDTDNILGHGDKGKIFTPVKFRAADTGVTVLCDAGSDTADSLNRKVYAFTTKDRGTMRTSGYCKRI